jgi:hypothetical protein
MKPKNEIEITTGATRYRSHGVVSRNPDEHPTYQGFHTNGRQPMGEV